MLGANRNPSSTRRHVTFTKSKKQQRSKPKECRDGQQKYTQTIIHRVVKSLLIEMFQPKVRRANHGDRVIARENSQMRDKEIIHYRTQAANKKHSFQTSQPWLGF